MGSKRSSGKWLVKDFVHQRRVDGVDGRRFVEWRSGFAAFNEPDGLTRCAAQTVVNDQARFLARRRRLPGAVLVMLACEGRHDQPTRADQRRQRLAESHTTDNAAQFHAEQTPNSKLQIPKEFQASSSKQAPRERLLVFLGWIFFGAWNLELGAFIRRPPHR